MIWTTKPKKNPGGTTVFWGAAGALGDSSRQDSHRKLGAFAWVTLAYNVTVILWGAYVRVTGSGAGCGNHWPLCNGEVIPRAQHIQTLIEFTHRVSSGIALLTVVCLWIWTRLAMPRKHPARYAGTAAVLLIINEALLGASLVLFQHVAQDKSIARAVSLSLHSANTMLLLAAIALTAFWTWNPSSSLLRWSACYATRIGALLLILLFAGVTGAVTALGDTLFPAASLASSLAQDFSPNSHYLLRLRIVHPAVALLAAISLTWVVAAVWRSPNKALQCLAVIAGIVLILQLTLGALNVVLLAPMWLQMGHLLVADVLWITLVLLAAESLTIAGAQ
jgi:heme A synthase